MKNTLLLSFVSSLFLFSSCNDKAPSLNREYLSLSVGETFMLTSKKSAGYRSENEFVASVNEFGNVKGEHIGVAEIIATNQEGSDNCKVEVRSKYDWSIDPIIDFGMNVDELKNREKHQYYRKGSFSGGYVEVYIGKEEDEIKRYEYFFDGETNTLQQSDIYILATSPKVKELDKYFKERCFVIRTTDTKFDKYYLAPQKMFVYQSFPLNNLIRIVYVQAK